MCEIIIKCDKCKKVLNSINYKIKRLEKIINKNPNQQIAVRLLEQVDALKFCRKKLLEVECIKEIEREVTNEKSK